MIPYIVYPCWAIMFLTLWNYNLNFFAKELIDAKNAEIPGLLKVYYFHYLLSLSLKFCDEYWQRFVCFCMCDFVYVCIHARQHCSIQKDLSCTYTLRLNLVTQKCLRGIYNIVFIRLIGKMIVAYLYKQLLLLWGSPTLIPCLRVGSGNRDLSPVLRSTPIQDLSPCLMHGLFFPFRFPSLLHPFLSAFKL